MKLLFNKKYSAWTMTGLLGEEAKWFIGYSKNKHIFPDKEDCHIHKAYANEVELDLTGKWFIRYGKMSIEYRENNFFGYTYQWINEDEIVEVYGERKL